MSADDRTEGRSGLRDVRLGPVTLRAPGTPPRQFGGAHGHLWQWVGDGEHLLTLSLAARQTNLGKTPQGVPQHLGWEIDRVRKRLTPPVGTGASSAPEEVLVETRPVLVQGASDAAAVLIDGRLDGLETRTGLMVSTDGTHMHVLQVTVTATDGGSALAQEVLDQVRVHPWRMPT